MAEKKLSWNLMSLLLSKNTSVLSEAHPQFNRSIQLHRNTAHCMLAKNCNFTGIVKPKLVRNFALCFVSALLLFSCASYKQNIMFKPIEGYQPEVFKKEANAVEKNYVIQKNDYLTLQIY